ncbi:site-specific integrase [Deinococcus sp. PEB2-67]
MPQKFLTICKENSLERVYFKDCIEIINSSCRPNFLALTFVSMVIFSQHYEGEIVHILYSLIQIDQVIKYADSLSEGREDLFFTLINFEIDRRALTAIKGIDQTAGELIMLAFTMIEDVLYKLPRHETFALEKYHIHYSLSEFRTRSRTTSIEVIRNRLREEFRQLKYTDLDPEWSGEPPSRKFIRFICAITDPNSCPWADYLICYALVRSAQGEYEDEVIANVMQAESYFQYLKLKTSERTYPPEPAMSQIAATLNRRPDLYSLAVKFKILIYGYEAYISDPPIHWLNTVGKSEIELKLYKLIESNIDTNSPDEINIKIIAYLIKWRGSPYYLHLVLAAISILSNGEHQPNSALNIIYDTHQLLFRVANQQKAGSEEPLTARNIRRIIEQTMPGDAKEARKLKSLSVQYRSAWHAQQTFLVRSEEFPEDLNQLLLPDIGTRLRVRGKIDTKYLTQKYERQADIDFIADNWSKIHRCADINFTAIRAVMLAFRNATTFISPSHLKEAILLDVKIPGREETWHFKIWSPSIFVEYLDIKAPHIEDQFFLEYTGATGSGEVEGLWCKDLIHTWIDPQEAIKFERKWGRSPDWFSSSNTHLVTLRRELKYYFRHIIKKLRYDRPCLCLFTPEELYHAAIFGALSLRLTRYGAHRAHEILQLQYEEPSIRNIKVNGRHLSFMQILPKGHKETKSKAAAPAFKLVSDAADRAIEASLNFQKMSGQSYRAVMKADNKIQTGAFVFQTYGTVISTTTLNACIRFLTYSAFKGLPQIPNATTHIFRHGFAKKARKSGVSREQLAMILNHVNLQTTDFYARPTLNDQLSTITHIATQSGMWNRPKHLGELVTDTPDALNIAPDFLKMTEDEFESWLKAVEIDFEKLEWELFDRMHGAKV